MNDRYKKIFNIPQSENPYFEHLYARGYLISNKPYTVKENWQSCSFGNGLYITYDARNSCAYATYQDVWVFILGTVMDTLSWHMDSKKIAKKVASKYLLGESALYDYLDYLGGRYVIVYGNTENAYLIQDATGMRSVCYYRNDLLIASHYNIINNIVHADKNPFVEEMTQMDPVPWLLPGNTSPYVDIMIMMPNHRLSLTSMKLKRIFPRGPRLAVNVNTVMDYIADCCKKQMETLVRNKKLMVSITKGNDSRITMAATKGIQDSLLYYTYFGENDPEQMKDLNFTREFSQKYDLHYVEVPCSFSDPKDHYDSLTDICYHNHYHFHLFYSIPNMLKLLPSDRTAVRSNLIEIIRADYYSDLPQNSSWEMIANRLYYGHLMENEEYRQIMKTFYLENEYDKLFDYYTGDLIYWEYRMGLWMNNGVLLKDDICFDTYMLFNHRKMLEYGLGLPRYFKKKNTVVYETIRRLWPEMLYELPNSNSTLLDYYLTDNRNLVPIQNGTVRGYHVHDKNEVSIYSNIGAHHIVLGFGSSQIRKGSICEYAVDLSIKNEGVYVIQLTVFVSNELSYFSNFANYSVYCDEEKVFTIGITEFMNKDNQINIIKFLKTGMHPLRICIKAEKDYTAANGIPAIVQIRNISMSRQWNYSVPKETIITSTSNLFQKVIALK